MADSIPTTENNVGHQANTTATAASPPSARRRLLLIWGLAVVTGIATLVLALEIFVARRLPELTMERLETAREKWDQSGPQSYDLSLEILGERPGPVHIEVRGREVDNVMINGRAPSAHTRHTWTVDGQFNTLEQELLLAEDPVHQMQAKPGVSLRLRCEFDSQFGYPREYQRTVSGGGPDVYWRVTSFVPR
jgi:hypothetical protein